MPLPSLRLAVLLLAVVEAAAAANLVVVAPAAELPGLQQRAQAWEADTGHWLTWLPDESDHAAAADVLIVSLAEAEQRARAGELRQVDRTAMPPLLAEAACDSETCMGVPLRAGLLAINIDARLLAQAELELPDAVDWDGLFALARRLANPIGNVHGLCLTGQRHAMLIRALLHDAGKSWLAERGTPFAAPAWREQGVRYARELAQAAPPNVASLSPIEVDALLSAGRCAMWIAPPAPVAPHVAPLPLPGVAAYANNHMQVAVLLAATEQPAVALEFAQWLATSMRPGAGSWEAAALAQPGTRDWHRRGGEIVPWARVDDAAENALRQHIDGLLSLEDALDAASAALKAAP